MKYKHTHTPNANIIPLYSSLQCSALKYNVEIQNANAKYRCELQQQNTDKNYKNNVKIGSSAIKQLKYIAMQCAEQ